jgi:hypothetical protein
MLWVQYSMQRAMVHRNSPTRLKLSATRFRFAVVSNAVAIRESSTGGERAPCCILQSAAPHSCGRHRHPPDNINHNHNIKTNQPPPNQPLKCSPPSQPPSCASATCPRATHERPLRPAAAQTSSPATSSSPEPRRPRSARTTTTTTKAATSNSRRKPTHRHRRDSDEDERE